MSHNQFSYTQQALAQQPAKLKLTNLKLVNLLSGRIQENISVLITPPFIVAITENNDYKAEDTIDLKGQFLYPGLIDAHIHCESSKLTINALAERLVSCGTSSLITDPHEFANVAGLEALHYQIQAGINCPYLNIFFAIPSCVPALKDSNIESFANILSASDLLQFTRLPNTVALAEVMNLPGLLNHDPDLHQKINDFMNAKLKIDGHAPLLSGPPLNAMIALGVRSDHESTNLEEAQQKLDRGLYIMIREGSSERNLKELLPLINEYNSSRILFASDDLDPIDINERGHLNFMLQQAVKFGIPPIRALQMASLNTATYFNIQHQHGAIFPGAYADLVVSPDLQNFIPSITFHHGNIVYQNNKHIPQKTTQPEPLRPTVNIKLPALDKLKLYAQPKQKIRAIKIIPDQILTDEHIFTPKLNPNNTISTDPENDIAKIVVFERHNATGFFATAFITGFGIKSGAIGSTVAHDSHNCIIVGITDEEILQVAEKIKQMDGGLAATSNGQWKTLPLPIAGLVSDKDFNTVLNEEIELNDFCQKHCKIKLQRPFSTLSFLSLPVIPLLRITDRGLFEIKPGSYPQPVSIVHTP